MIEYTSDTRPLDADPLDVWRQIPAELDSATRLRIERRAWQLLAAPHVRAIRVAICGVALLVGGLLTLAGALSDVLPLFGLAAAAHVVALAGWALWFTRWE